MELAIPQKNLQLQGLRALAAGGVVMTHCGVLRQYGQIGDVLFFCLSGFFAIKPFSGGGFEIHSIKDVLQYYKKKAVNVLPSYWGFLIILKMLTDNKVFTWSSLIKALFFINCPNHLWFIQQIAVLYLFTPGIVIILQVIDKCVELVYPQFCYQECVRWLIRVVVLTAVSIASYYFFRFCAPYSMELLGSEDVQYLRIYQYLFGIAIGCLYRWYLIKRIRIKSFILGIVAGVIIISSIVTSDAIVKFFFPEITQFYKVYWSGELDWPILVLSGILILILALDNENIVSRIFGTRLLVSLGNVSLETYIIHYFMIPPLLLSSTPLKNFIFVYYVTICMSFGIKVIKREATEIMRILNKRIKESV